MPLAMRPTGLGRGFYKAAVDYSVFSGKWAIGRIYERHGFAPEVTVLLVALWRRTDESTEHPHRWIRADPGDGKGAAPAELGSVAGVVGTGRACRA
jgi:hypothetical protein